MKKLIVFILIVSFSCTNSSYDDIVNEDLTLKLAFAIAGLISKDQIIILNTENVSTSFPGFFSLIKDMGLKIKREKKTVDLKQYIELFQI